jgi:hypothetical protein
MSNTSNRIEEARQKFMHGQISAKEYWDIRVAELSKHITKEKS